MLNGSLEEMFDDFVPNGSSARTPKSSQWDFGILKIWKKMEKL